jgi:hypothetical protein
VNGLCVRAAGAGRQYAPAAPDRRFWAPPNFTVRRLLCASPQLLTASGGLP